jgi:hypothetical protein
MRGLNHRLVKAHRSYTVDEIARLFGIHKHTVRNWIRRGLATIDGERPALIHGPTLAAFLEDRREKPSHPCAAGEIYCVKCRVPRRPPSGEYGAYSVGAGALRRVCSDCGTVIHRCISLAKLDQVRGDLEITFSKNPQHIRESSSPFDA